MIPNIDAPPGRKIGGPFHHRQLHVGQRNPLVAVRFPGVRLNGAIVQTRKHVNQLVFDQPVSDVLFVDRLEYLPKLALDPHFFAEPAFGSRQRRLARARVAAAGVRPLSLGVIFAGLPLLQKQPALSVVDEDGNRPVQVPFAMRGELSLQADFPVLGVHENNLLFGVAIDQLFHPAALCASYFRCLYVMLMRTGRLLNRKARYSTGKSAANNGKKRMRTGKAYIDSLRDGREVWLNGERVKDVTEHPHLRPSIDSTARLYDMQFEAAHRDTLTVHSPDMGAEIGRTFQIPRTREDLQRGVTRRGSGWRAHFGFMGRAPDFLNATVMALKTKSAFFAQQSSERQQAVEAYYLHAASQDIFLTHALNDPLPNKTRARHAQEDAGVVLHGVDETSKGLIVSGAKVVATAAAYANEAIVFPMPNNLVPGDERHALAACIPMDAPGLKVLCRASFAHPGRKEDFPLSSRFDEMDSVLVFDRVLIPWDRVFLYGDVKLINALFAGCRVRT